MVIAGSVEICSGINVEVETEEEKKRIENMATISITLTLTHALAFDNVFFFIVLNSPYQPLNRIISFKEYIKFSIPHS